VLGPKWRDRKETKILGPEWEDSRDTKVAGIGPEVSER